MFADDILGPVKQWGYLVKDLDQAMDCWISQLGVDTMDEFYASSIVSIPSGILPNGYTHRYSKVAGRTYGLEMRYRW